MRFCQLVEVQCQKVCSPSLQRGLVDYKYCTVKIYCTVEIYSRKLVLKLYLKGQCHENFDLRFGQQTLFRPHMNRLKRFCLGPRYSRVFFIWNLVTLLLHITKFWQENMHLAQYVQWLRGESPSSIRKNASITVVLQ